VILTACQESPEEQVRRELRERNRLEQQKTWAGQLTCIEVIKAVSRNPATTKVPLLYNMIDIDNVLFTNGHIARFQWSGFNMVQAQNGFGLVVGVEASCEYDINTDQVYTLIFDGQAFIRNGAIL
tara:strand:+ start:305 stop:679 length:375 start_codon:yes stop_codon:yes gene_type:complete